LTKLEEIASTKHVVMIGECGLDRLQGPKFSQQLAAFEAQAALASRTGKPLIIHCVRAFDSLLSFQKQHRIANPMIIHGFRGNPTLARQLTSKGYFLSFGPQILHNRIHAQTLLQGLNHPFFIETDIHSLPIEQLYEEFAFLLNIPLEELKDRIFAAWKLIGLR